MKRTRYLKCSIPQGLKMFIQQTYELVPAECIQLFSFGIEQFRAREKEFIDTFNMEHSNQ